MARLWYLDSLFEYKLDPRRSTLEAGLLRRNRCLEKLFLVVANPNDFVFLEEEPPEDLLEYWNVLGFPIGQPIVNGASLSDDIELIEWGKRHRFHEGELVIDESLESTSRRLNSKLEQWEIRKEISPLRGRILRSEEDLVYQWEETHSPFVLKAEFGLAGRNMILVESPGQSWKSNQVETKLGGYPILWEEWVGRDRILDFSSLWDVKEGRFTFLSSTKMWIDEKGAFLGIQLDATGTSVWIPEVYDSIRKCQGNHFSEYTGVCAVDSFLYRKNGELILQPISEFNFRYSMGRILWEIRKKRNPKENLISSLVILPFPKEKKGIDWIRPLQWQEKWKETILQLTPSADWKKKPYQNFVFYFETTEENIPQRMRELYEVWNS